MESREEEKLGGLGAQNPDWTRNLVDGVILLMVQESQGPPPGMVLKPCKQWDKLPVSHPCCRILSINRIGGAI